MFYYHNNRSGEKLVWWEVKWDKGLDTRAKNQII